MAELLLPPGAPMRRKHKNMKRPRMRLIITIIALLLAAAVVVWFIAASGDTMSASAQKMPFYASYPHEFTGGGFLYTEGLTLNYYDINKESVQYTAALPTVDVRLSGEGSTHVLYNDTSLQIINAEFPIESSGEIISVKCGGGFIAVHKRENDMDSLRIFSSAGSQVDELVFENTSLMDFDFYNTDGKWSLYSLETDVTAELPVSTLTTYSLNPSATTGIAVVQNQLISDVVFSASSIFVTGTSNIIRFNAKTNTESYRLLCYGFYILDSSLTGSTAVFVAAPNGVDRHALSHVRIYSAAENDVPEESMAVLQLPRNTLGVFASGNRIYVITPDSILKYSTSAELLETEALPFVATDALKLSSDKLLIYAGEEAYMLSFIP